MEAQQVQNTRTYEQFQQLDGFNVLLLINIVYRIQCYIIIKSQQFSSMYTGTFPTWSNVQRLHLISRKQLLLKLLKCLFIYNSPALQSNTAFAEPLQTCVSLPLSTSPEYVHPFQDQRDSIPAHSHSRQKMSAGWLLVVQRMTPIRLRADRLLQAPQLLSFPTHELTKWKESLLNVIKMRLRKDRSRKRDDCSLGNT